MRRPDPRQSPGRRRPGQTLVLFALLLPVLLGMVGLVIDAGLLMAGMRQTQNAADAAALAASMDRVRGKTKLGATATATTFVKDLQYNGLINATVAINIPPLSGPYAGDSDYTEAVVTCPVQTSFIQVLGVNPDQRVQARAVSGYESTAVGLGAMALDPVARPGLSADGGGTLKVKGTVIVNSEGAGLNEKNEWVDLGMQSYAAATSNNSTLKSSEFLVVGGVDTPSNYQPYLAGDSSPLRAGGLPRPDPLKNVPVPVAGMPGVNTTSRGSFTANNGTHTLNPGIYTSIKITNGASVTFNPGVYILKVASNTTNALSLSGGGKITGNGVMFYNTGSDFNVSTGLPDINDGENRPPAPGNANFGDITINASDTDLKGINDPTSPFDGLLIYQRRRNTSTVDLQGNGAGNKLEGTVYAKWANLKLAGTATYGAQFIVGSITVSGGANMTFNTSDKHLANPVQVFLVE